MRKSSQVKKKKLHITKVNDKIKMIVKTMLEGADRKSMLPTLVFHFGFQTHCTSGNKISSFLRSSTSLKCLTIVSDYHMITLPLAISLWSLWPYSSSCSIFWWYNQGSAGGACMLPLQPWSETVNMKKMSTYKFLGCSHLFTTDNAGCITSA